MTKITPKMKEYLSHNLYESLHVIAENVAHGSDVDAADVAAWVASESEEHADISDEETWPLIAQMAELVTIAMRAQYLACCNAAYEKCD
jgi:hypothetical protein